MYVIIEITSKKGRREDRKTRSKGILEGSPKLTGVLEVE